MIFLIKSKYLTLVFYFLFILHIFGQNVKDPKEGEEILSSIELSVSSEYPGIGYTVRVYGREQNITNDFGETKIYVEYLGIPFAKPALGHLRFQRPTLDNPRRNFQAVKEPPPCPQLSATGTVLGDESCLFLNIYAPKEISSSGNSPKNKLPVLVWFHGEALDKSADGIFSVFSSGSIRELQPEIFVQNNVLVVTPQYRLGSLGFISTANEDLSGNMGLFDQLLALEWTQKFIGDFGGDSKQVTVLGHGSAAVSVGLLATSDLTKGLLHRVIMMGGSALSPFSVDARPKATFAETALQNGCSAFPTLRFVRCMQQKSFEDLVKSDDAVLKGKHIGKSRMPLPVIQRDPDGRFLPPVLSRLPINSLTSGNFEHVPLIIGVTSAEMSGFLPNLAGKERHEIPLTIFANSNILNQFIRAVLSRSSDGNPDLLADLVSFEYFAGLNVTDPMRQEQAVDIVEEALSDFLFHMPALNMAKLWSRYAPVHFYVFDYVSSPFGASVDGSNGSNFKRKRLAPREFSGGGSLQASHGSDLRFLMDGSGGSAKDREIANTITHFWTSFIHKGSPLHSGLDWPQFREDSLKYLHISEQVQISSGFRSRKDNLWNTLLEKTAEHACNPNTRRRPSQNLVEYKENEKLRNAFLPENPAFDIHTDFHAPVWE